VKNEKQKKYHTVCTIPKSNIKIVERGKIDTHNTQIHDSLISWLGTDTSIKSGRIKLVLWAQTSLQTKITEMLFYCQNKDDRTVPF